MAEIQMKANGKKWLAENPWKSLLDSSLVAIDMDGKFCRGPDDHHQAIIAGASAPNRSWQ